MNNNLNTIDLINVISFGVGLYALYIALENLKLNDSQSNELKQILKYLDVHLQQQDEHLASQDKILENLEESKIYRTDQYGSIIFKIKNNKLKIETCTP